MHPSSSARPARPRRAILVLAALCLLGTFVAAPARAYVLEGYKWPAGDIVMYLQLGSASGLIDGASSWDDVAASALGIWNPNLGNVQFRVAATTITPVSGDGKNSVLFSDTVFGSAFGSDTLAITRTRFRGTTTVEADVTCNTAFKFNSYRGNLRTGSGGVMIYDLRRILLHEFGHVLGLDHTPQGTQSIMVPATNNLDTIQADDIAGVAELYGGVAAPVSAPVLSSGTTAGATAGSAFSYQITATNSPTGFGVAGLPAGLSCNTTTGLISGTPTMAGTYNVILSATNSGGTGTATLTLTVGSPHPAFFAGEIPLSGGVYYLTFSNGNIFSYYQYLTDPHFIYHFDMGFEYWSDAADGRGGIYFYDFKSGDWLYTSPAFPFPYLYDFNLQTFLYYYPNPTNPQRYNTGGVRYFYNFSTGRIITR